MSKLKEKLMEDKTQVALILLYLLVWLILVLTGAGV